MAKKLISVTLTPTVSASAIYASGDAIGGKLTFPLLPGVNGGEAKLMKVQLLDSDKQSAAMDLVLFSADFTPTADNAAMAVSTSDLANCVGHVSVAAADYAAFNATSNATKIPALPLAMILAGQNAYGQLVSRGTPTYTGTTKLSVKCVFEIDA